jgi:NADH:ubiquinone oxidoreductase subunit K
MRIIHANTMSNILLLLAVAVAAMELAAAVAVQVVIVHLSQVSHPAAVLQLKPL